MQIGEKLLGLGFAYKRTKLWKRLAEADLFAVRMTDGTLGYISITGSMGEYCALVLFEGPEGYACFQRIRTTDYAAITDAEMGDLSAANDCIHCILESKQDLPEDELELTRQYARSHGIRISGKNAYPHFLRYAPDRLPWKVNEARDQQHMEEALEAALYVSSLFEEEERAAEKEAFLSLVKKENTLPCLTREGERYALEEVAPPPLPEPVYPSPSIANELLIARLKKKKREGRLLFDLVRFDKAVQEGDDMAPYFPYLPFAIVDREERMLDINAVRDLQTASRELLEDFAQVLIDDNRCPKVIEVMNARSYAFLEPFCQRLKIRLEKKDDIPVLRETIADFLYHYDGVEPDDGLEIGGIDMIVDFLANLSDEELAGMPESMKEDLLGMADSMPEYVVKRLRQIWRV